MQEVRFQQCQTTVFGRSSDRTPGRPASPNLRVAPSSRQSAGIQEQHPTVCAQASRLGPAVPGTGEAAGLESGQQLEGLHCRPDEDRDKQQSLKEISAL